jgi:hypothetical protein
VHAAAKEIRKPGMTNVEMGGRPIVACRAARGHRWSVLTLVSALLVLTPAGSEAQDGAPDSVAVVPGARYHASGLHRFLFGSNYRDLWGTKIRVPVLHLGDSTSGLTPTEKGGGKQTQALRFSSGDGRSFVFRMFDKDPTKAWPELAKRVPLARNIAEDQTSALFPAGALAVSVLEESAGLRHTDQQLVFLADDPRLGKFRDEFKNQLGWLEQRVKTEDLDLFPGAAEIVNTEKLYQELIKSGKNVLDEREYLKARLFDLFVGDWDRHFDQWSWVRYDEPGRHRWAPVPRDRDWALSRIDGLVYAIIRHFAAEFQSFGDHYSSIAGLAYTALPLDRRLLSGLGKPVWDSVAAELKSRLTDRVIARAVEALPAALSARVHQELGRELRSRREQLPAAADKFYRMLASEIDLWGSNDADRVTLIRDPEGGLGLTLARDEQVVFARRLDPRDTKELRLILFRGPDTVRFLGTGPDRIRVRVVTGAGDNLVVDSTGSGNIRVYDDSGTTVVEGGRIGRSHRRFESNIDPTSPKEIRRDWGWTSGIAPWFEIGPEIGLLFGGGPKLTRHGFRKDPYRSDLALRVAYSTGAAGFDADLNGDFQFESPMFRVALRAALLSTGIQRFYGLGNDTPVPPSDTRLTVVLAKQYQFAPEIQFGSGNFTLGLGGKFQSSHTDLSIPSLLATVRPYGSGSFTEAGAMVSARIDTRDHRGYPTSGVVIEAQGAVFPQIFDVRERFATASIEARTYLTARPLPTKPTLALRAGASRAWGETPFFELPSLGGVADLRAISSRRFLGDRAVHGSAELRLDFGKFTLVTPGTWGIYGLTDVGRVYLTGQASNDWHTAGGGGLWFAFLDRRSTFTATYAVSDEGGRIYIRAGFHY